MFRRGKGSGGCNWDGENNIGTKLCGHIACFIDWRKTFQPVNWTKLMHSLKGTGIGWRYRRLISKLYVVRSVNVRLDRWGQDVRRSGAGQGCCL